MKKSIAMFCMVFFLLGVQGMAKASPVDCPAWSNTKPYPVNSCVTYQGASYIAKWWVEAGVAPYIGQNPWDSPWKLADDNPPPPPPPVDPGTPLLDPVPNSTDGMLRVNWKTIGNKGAYWELWNGDARMERFTQFTDGSNKAASAAISVNNGTYTVTVKLCNEKDVCATSNVQVASISGASDKKPFFVGYYPTWFAPYHNAFCDSSGRYYDYAAKGWLNCTPNVVLPDSTITSSALLAGGIPNYVTHVVIAFAKLNAMHNYKGLSHNDGDLQDVGLSLKTSSASLKESIRVLKKHNPGTKVILALGGASYNDSWNNVVAADITQLSQLIKDLSLDGLDVDYEVGGTDTDNINKYYDSIVAMRKAVDSAGNGAMLTLAGWSTGADCTVQTQGANYPDCAGKISYWGGNAGRERLVMQGKGASTMIDIISIMSYDADYQHYDPVLAYKEYKKLAKPGALVALGVQPSPDEGWGVARTLIDDRGINNDCVGNTILEDQYNTKTPGTFSIQRFANEIKKNAGDGMMMWSLFAARNSTLCGSVKMSTVTEVGQGVSQYLGIGSDRTTQIDWNTAINYGHH